MTTERIHLPPLTIEHDSGSITVTHQSGMKTTVGASRLSTWAMGLLRKELTLKPELSDASVAAVDSIIGKL